jgi:hypothetical protein
MEKGKMFMFDKDRTTEEGISHLRNRHHQRIVENGEKQSSRFDEEPA